MEESFIFLIANILGGSTQSTGCRRGFREKESHQREGETFGESETAGSRAGMPPVGIEQQGN